MGKRTVGAVLELTAPTNGNYRGGYCYKPPLQIIFVEAASVTSRTYKLVCNYKSALICSNGFVGAIGPAAPTNPYEPPLQILAAVVRRVVDVAVAATLIAVRPKWKDGTTTRNKRRVASSEEGHDSQRTT